MFSVGREVKRSLIWYAVVCLLETRLKVLQVLTYQLAEYPVERAAMSRAGGLASTRD
jgi:hypothetical protein